MDGNLPLRKIATAKENGFDLGPGETWVESY